MTARPIPSPLRFVARAVSPLALACAALVPALGAEGCAGCSQATGPRALAIMPGVINRSDNRSLRFAMLKFGLDEFCGQMLHRGAPLRLVDDQPPIGRFFAQKCETRVLDDESNKSFVVQFTGYGYAWTNATQRFGFEAAGVVEYAPDFLLDDSTMYIYFRTKHIGASSFNVGMVESQIANAAMGTLLPGDAANKLGQQIVSSELSRGLTVIRDADGSVDFGVGMVEKGKRPFHPYQVKGSSKVALANERIEVHANQREYLGPFQVDSDGRALFLTMSVDGSPAVDVFVMPKDAADGWLGQYAHQRETTPPPFAPLMADVVASAGEWKKALPVGTGYYYLVIDNTATAGRVAPPPALMDDRAALVNYVVEVGDAP